MNWPDVSRVADKELARYVLTDLAAEFALAQEREVALQSAQGMRALVGELYQALCRRNISYALEPFNADPRVQTIRPPSGVLEGDLEGTCLDLALLFAGLALGKGLLPLLVVLQGHALVAVSLQRTRAQAADFGRSSPQQDGPWVEEGLLHDGATLRHLVDTGQYLLLECTGFAASTALPPGLPEGQGRDPLSARMPFDAALAAGRAQLDAPGRGFRFAIDLAVLRDHHGIQAFEPPILETGAPHREQLRRLLSRDPLFGGREAELAWLDNSLGHTPQGHVFVIGDSGCGKSALLAHWVQGLRLGRAALLSPHSPLSPRAPLDQPAQPAPPEPLPLRLVHVFMQRQAGTAEQGAVLYLLCLQLLHAHGLSGQPPADPSALWQRCIELMARQPPPGRRMVVVLDGLDEAEAQGWDPRQLLPPVPAERCHIVFSARRMADRDTPQWLQWLQLPPAGVAVLALPLLSPAALVALLRQAPEALAAKADDAAFTAALHEVTDGDPMVVSLLLQDLLAAQAQGQALSVALVQKKPRGLSAYLKAWWQDLARQGQAQASVRDLLGYLLVARGPLSRELLLELDEHDHLDSFSIDDAIQHIRRYVLGDERSGWRMGHPRLREFLLDGQTIRHADLRGVAASLAQRCEALWPAALQQPQPVEGDALPPPVYAAQYVLGQLREWHDRAAPDELAGITARMLVLVRAPALRQWRLQQPGGLPFDRSDVQDLLAAAQSDPLPACLAQLADAAEAGSALRGALGQRVALVFEQAALGHPHGAAHKLPVLAPSARWSAAMLLVACGLAARADRAAARRCRDEVAGQALPSGFDATLHLLNARVQALLDELPPAPGWPLPYGARVLPMADTSPPLARAVMLRMGGLADAEVLHAAFHHSMIQPGPSGLAHPDGLPALLAERDGPLLVANAVRAAGEPAYGMSPTEADGLLRAYVAAHAANPYREYRQRSLWAVLGAALCHPDPSIALGTARQVCEAAAQPTTVDQREPLRLAALGLAARAGDTQAALQLQQLRDQACEAAARLHPLRTGSDLWGTHARRLAALAEVASLTGADAAQAALLLDQAHQLPYGYAGFQAVASLSVADADFIARPQHTEALDHALAAARRSAHNVQESRYCALSTARVATLSGRWRPGSVAGLPALVRRFALEPGAQEFMPRLAVGEAFDQRNTGPEMLPLERPLREARCLDDVARHVLGLPCEELLRCNGGAGARDVLAEVAFPDPGFAPLLAARLSAELLGRRAELGPQLVPLLASLVTVASHDPTALNLVLSRLALGCAPQDPVLLQALLRVAPEDWMNEPMPVRLVEA